MSEVQQAFHSPLSPRQLFAEQHKQRRIRMEARAVPDDGILSVRGHSARKVQVPAAELQDLVEREAEARQTIERQAKELLKFCGRMAEAEEQISILKQRLDNHFPFILSAVTTIQRAVVAHYNITMLDLLSARRTKDVTFPRQVAMYLAKTLTPRSLPEIGRRFGGRDHTTILHAVRKIEALRLTDPKLDEEIKQIEASINAALAWRAPTAAGAEGAA